MRYRLYPQERFQSTLPRRERPPKRLRDARAFKFQSTLPRRERLQGPGRGESLRQFQSTLPRRERRVMPGYTIGIAKFQSTLPRRERLDETMTKIGFDGFNPRSHAGSDSNNAKRLTRETRVSIHAPTQGATAARARDAVAAWFQSTLPRRERLFKLK